MKKSNMIIRSIIYGVLILAIFVCQFVPFWRTGAPIMDQSSLIGMTGRQYNHENMIEDLNAITNGFSYLDISTPVLLTIVFAACGVLAAIKGANGIWKAIFALVPAGCGIYLWLKVPAYTLGMVGHVIFALDILMILCCIFELVMFFVELKASKSEEQ